MFLHLNEYYEDRRGLCASPRASRTFEGGIEWPPASRYCHSSVTLRLSLYGTAFPLDRPGMSTRLRRTVTQTCSTCRLRSQTGLESQKKSGPYHRMNVWFFIVRLRFIICPLAYSVSFYDRSSFVIISRYGLYNISLSKRFLQA